MGEPEENKPEIPLDAVQRELKERLNLDSMEIFPDLLLPRQRRIFEDLKTASPDLKLYWTPYDKPNPDLQQLGDGSSVYVVDYSQVITTETLMALRLPSSKRLQSFGTPPDETLLKDFALLSQRSNIYPPPTVLLLKDGMPLKQTGTLLSSDGEIFVYLKEPDLPYKQKLAVLGHELGHVKNGDVSLYAYVNRHNNEETVFQNQQREYSADARVADLCLGKELARERINKERSNSTASYLNIASDKDWDTYINEQYPLTALLQNTSPFFTHPPNINRADNLLQTHKLLVEQGYCPAEGPPPPAPTPVAAPETAPDIPATAIPPKGRGQKQ